MIGEAMNAAHEAAAKLNEVVGGICGAREVLRLTKNAAFEAFGDKEP